MTDEQLDYLQSLGDAVTLENGDEQIAVLPVLVAEIKRLRAVIAALREPSKAVWTSVNQAYWSSWGAEDLWTMAIRAAVAAAEREADA